VGCIVKKLSRASSLPEEELDDRGQVRALAPVARAAFARADVRHLAVPFGHDQRPRQPQLVVKTVRGRRAMEDLVTAMARHLRREVTALAERHVVSRFTYTVRIQVAVLVVL
jgi:protein neuralized